MDVSPYRRASHLSYWEGVPKIWYFQRYLRVRALGGNGMVRLRDPHVVYRWCQKHLPPGLSSHCRIQFIVLTERAPKICHFGCNLRHNLSGIWYDETHMVGGLQMLSGGPPTYIMHQIKVWEILHKRWIYFLLVYHYSLQYWEGTKNLLFLE